MLVFTLFPSEGIHIVYAPAEFLGAISFLGYLPHNKYSYILDCTDYLLTNCRHFPLLAISQIACLNHEGSYIVIPSFKLKAQLSVDLKQFPNKIFYVINVATQFFLFFWQVLLWRYNTRYMYQPKYYLGQI